MTIDRPVPENEIPENFVLKPEQKKQRKDPIPYLLNFGIYLSSGILPSGHENYFDKTQDPDNKAGFPINAFYPSPMNPDGSFAGTGLLATYYPSGYPEEIPEIKRIRGGFNPDESGILHYKNLIGRFSNVSGVSGIAVQDFNIFNSYIHYYPKDSEITNSNKDKDFPVFIPYVSDYASGDAISPYYSIFQDDYFFQ